MALVTIIGRGHSGTRSISHTLYASNVYMGACLNRSGDLIPPQAMYDACRVMARYVQWTGDLTWDFHQLYEMEIPQEFTDLLNEFNDFHAGNWIMLMRKVRLSATEERTVYRWYKVIAADDELDSTNTQRTVTLDGPDWTVDTTASGDYPTFAVIVPGVVAVYEKIVRLEGSSLYEF